MKATITETKSGIETNWTQRWPLAIVAEFRCGMMPLDCDDVDINRFPWA